ncbi:MAG TPA: PQQ-binding-like beta-propeller repeat protein [Pyrinomonadaceae bacterium]|nr:PQQ-binding-like beta-propeller repeat protein [Pyrinomonadaceae bacterium]
MYLYIGTNGSVAAIDPQTGNEVWRTELSSSGFFSSMGGSDVCVLEHEGQVFAGSNGYVFALDGATGDILWENGLEGMGHNDVTLSIAGKSIQFVATHTHTNT